VRLRSISFCDFLLAILLSSAAQVALAKTPADPLDKEWAKIQAPGPNLGSRELTGFILEAAGGPDSAQRAGQIEQAFLDLEKMQDRDPASKTYGNLCWYWHEVKPGDRNAVEFVTQQALVAWLLRRMAATI